MKTQALSALASELVRAGLELAARGHDGAHKFNGSGDEPVTQGGGPSPSPIAAAVGGDPVREWGNKRDGANPASGSSGDSKREGENAPASRLDLGGSIRIVSVNDRCTAPPHGRAPRPAVHLSLVPAHRSHSAKSGSARATKNKMAQMTQSF